jgi:hypothetical protein
MSIMNSKGSRNLRVKQGEEVMPNQKPRKDDTGSDGVMP